MAIRIFTLIVTVLCLAAPAAAKLPGIDDPKAYTDAQFRRDLLAFNKETMSGVYLKASAGGNAWDEEAVAFLDGMALRYANSGASVISTMPGQKPDADLLAAGASVVDEGCEDPMVLYCYGSLLQASGDVDKARPRLQAASRAMVDSPYPMFRKVRAVSRYLFTPRLPGEKDNRKWAAAFLTDNVGKVASGPECKGAGRRLILLSLPDSVSGTDVFFHMSAEQAAALVAAEPTADVWVKNMLLGQAAITRAWTARGSGLANTVTEAGWKGFYEALGTARDHFQLAYEADPKLPEAAAQMVVVAMGAGEDLRRKEREWFDRAIKAQLDFRPAFHNYRYAISPRWGGSHVAMFALAREALDGNRYDTDLPFMFRDSVDAIIADGGSAVVLTQPAYAVAAPVYDKLAAKMPTPQFADYHRTWKLGLATKLRKYDDALATLDAMAGPPAPEPLARLDLTADDVVGKVRAMTGPQKVALRAIEAKLLANKQADVTADLKRVLAALPPDDPGAAFVRARVEAADVGQGLAKGDWVGVQPDAALNGWTPKLGKWAVDGKAVVGTFVGPPNRAAGLPPGQLLVYKAKLGPRFAVRGTLSGESSMYGFVVAGDPLRNVYDGVWIAGRGQQVMVGVPTPGALPTMVALDGKPAAREVLVEVWDGRVWVSVDGKRVAAGRPLLPGAPGLALFSVAAEQEKPSRYENVAVLKLTKRPE